LHNEGKELASALVTRLFPTVVSEHRLSNHILA